MALDRIEYFTDLVAEDPSEPRARYGLAVALRQAERHAEAIDQYRAYLAIMGLGLGAYLTQVDGISYVQFIAPGVAASAVMFGAILETSYNTFVRIHVRRVFEAAVTTPLSVGDVVVGEYLWGATRGTIYGVVFLGVMACFGLVASWWAILCPLVFIIGALTFAVLGMTYTSFAKNIEHFNIFWTGVLTPMFLFSGIFFPFSGLPDWAQVIGWCLPLSHFVAASRELVMGDVGWLTVAHIAVLIGFTVVFFMVPIRRLRRTLLA